MDILADSKKLPPSDSVPMQTETTLSNGTVVTYEQARRFMDWYCRRYRFPAPQIDCQCFNSAKIKDVKVNGDQVQGAKLTQVANKQAAKREWNAIMTVGGRRIGIGAGLSEEAAQTACCLDATQYLESCDAELWRIYVEGEDGSGLRRA